MRTALARGRPGSPAAAAAAVRVITGLTTVRAAGAAGPRPVPLRMRTLQGSLHWHATAAACRRTCLVQYQ